MPFLQIKNLQTSLECLFLQDYFQPMYLSHYRFVGTYFFSSFLLSILMLDLPAAEFGPTDFITFFALLTVEKMAGADRALFAHLDESGKLCVENAPLEFVSNLVEYSDRKFLGSDLNAE